MNELILVVDDETDITANIAPVLERSGFVVATAVNDTPNVVKEGTGVPLSDRDKASASIL